MEEHQTKYDPERLAMAHRLMEWSNIIVIACAALGATAWFTSHLVLFYVLGSIALILTLLFMWGPVIVGIAGPGEGRIVNGILFIVIGILITHRFWAGLILGGCFFGLFSMLPLAAEMYRMRRKERQNECKVAEEAPALVIDKDRDKRINQMSGAYGQLREVADTLGEATEELEAIASHVDVLKDYLVSGQWMEDYEADERGEIGPDVDRSVLSQDGLYNLMEDLDEIMHSFERLEERFAADPELDKILQEE